MGKRLLTLPSLKTNETRGYLYLLFRVAKSFKLLIIRITALEQV